MLKETTIFEIEELFDEILNKAKVADISYEELSQTLKLLYEEREK